LRRRLTEYTTYYEISEEGKKKKMIKKEIRVLFRVSKNSIIFIVFALLRSKKLEMHVRK